MTRPDSPLQHLIEWAADADDSRSRRRAALWGSARTGLAGYATIGDLVRSAWDDPEMAADLLGDLVAVASADEVATQAALAIVAPGLAGVVARWAAAGVPAGDLEDMESELLAETLTALRSRPGPRPPGVVVAAAWAAVRTRRRRDRRELSRLVALDPAAAESAVFQEGRPVLAVAASTVLDGYRSGRLSLPAAQALWATGVAGWPAADAAVRLGCRPDALRARRCRAIRALAA